MTSEALERRRVRNREYMRRRRQTEEYKVYQRAYTAKYRRARPEKIARWNRRHLLKRYGLTPGTYAALQESQDGLCGICYSEPATHIDHDHETGRVRGLLCENCNRALGIMRDDPERLRAAADYLEGG